MAQSIILPRGPGRPPGSKNKPRPASVPKVTRRKTSPNLGGARPGAGRKTHGNAELAAMAKDSPLMPAEFLLSIMRDESRPLEMRIDAAKACLPFCHPRLVSKRVEHVGDTRERQIRELVETLRASDKARSQS